MRVYIYIESLLEEQGNFKLQKMPVQYQKISLAGSALLK